MTGGRSGVPRDASSKRLSYTPDDDTFFPKARLNGTGRGRRRGVTIRNSVDCLIAAVAIEHDIPLLHHDRDVDPIAEHGGLHVIRTNGKPTPASGVRGEPRR